MRWPLRWFVLVPVVTLGAPAPADAACPEPDVRVAFAAEPTAQPASAFAAQLTSAVAVVCGWWGTTYDGPFDVRVETAPGPSMALVPAWRGERGRMQFSMRAVAAGRAATVHEVVHVFAPNANRFLAEGLAVYAHAHLGGPAAYPNFGADLHALARRQAQGVDLAALDRLATPERLQLAGLDEREAYIVAGSFVRFLVEAFGLPRFRQLYALTPLQPGGRDAGAVDRWQQVFGLSLPILERRWRETIGRG